VPTSHCETTAPPDSREKLAAPPCPHAPLARRAGSLYNGCRLLSSCSPCRPPFSSPFPYAPSPPVVCHCTWCPARRALCVGGGFSLLLGGCGAAHAVHKSVYAWAIIESLWRPAPRVPRMHELSSSCLVTCCLHCMLPAPFGVSMTLWRGSTPPFALVVMPSTDGLPSSEFLLLRSHADGRSSASPFRLDVSRLKAPPVRTRRVL